MHLLVSKFSFLLCLGLLGLAGATSRSSARYRLREKVDLNYPDKHPDVAAAAQYVQYTSPYDGHPSENNHLSRRQRFYALLTLNLPILTMMGVVMFLPGVTNMSRKRRSLADLKPDPLRTLKTFHKALEAFEKRRK